jgi:hypothetical protein
VGISRSANIKGVKGGEVKKKLLEALALWIGQLNAKHI